MLTLKLIAFCLFFGPLEKNDTKCFKISIRCHYKNPFPTRTTYDVAVRYYMEICDSVSRQFISTLAAFGTNGCLKVEHVKLGKHRGYFAEVVSNIRRRSRRGGSAYIEHVGCEEEKDSSECGTHDRIGSTEEKNRNSELNIKVRSMDESTDINIEKL